MWLCNWIENMCTLTLSYQSKWSAEKERDPGDRQRLRPEIRERSLASHVICDWN